MSEDAPLRIVSLEVDSFMRIDAVALEPTPTGLIRIEGRNRQGKSSILAAIEAALGGARHTPAEPVKRGAKKAQVKLDLGEYTVERNFKPDGSAELIVKADGKGSPIKTPQALLDKFKSDVAFDPLRFAGMKPKEQADELLRLAGVDVSGLDEEIKERFDARTQVARDLKAAEGRVPTGIIPSSLPDTPIDVAAISKEIQEAAEHNASIQQRTGMLARRTQERDSLVAQIKSLQGQLASLHEWVQQEEKVVAKLERIDTTLLQQRVAEAADLNNLIAKRSQKWTTEAEVEALATQHAELDGEIDRLRNLRAEKLAAARLPVDGLAIGPDGVTLGGVPFEQASTREQLNASVAIGLAQGGRLRIALVREGSSLDESGLRELAEIAQAQGAQVFIERVSDSQNPAAFVISDGAIVSEPK